MAPSFEALGYNDNPRQALYFISHHKMYAIPNLANSLFDSHYLMPNLEEKFARPTFLGWIECVSL